MASAVFFTDLKGKALIYRNFRNDAPKSCVDIFVKTVIRNTDDDNAGGGEEAAEDTVTSARLTPFFEENGFSFAYVKHQDIYLVLVARNNTNAMMLMSYLHSIISVFQHYFHELEEESVKDNFTVVYELLDEMMDFGFPQITEPKLLQEFIKMESHKLSIDTKAILGLISNLNLGPGVQSIIQANLNNINTKMNQWSNQIGHLSSASGWGSDVTSSSAQSSNKVTIPKHFTKSINWRNPDIKYKKNECFLDVVENVNMVINHAGQVIKSEIMGVLKMRCFLSGMPDLKLGLNDKVLFENLGRDVAKGKAVELEDVKFHQCVRLNKFENERTIIFIPPDGEFDLMSYRLNTRVKPLFLVDCATKLHSESRIEYKIRIKSQYKKNSMANNVKIKIPTPPNADSPICLKCDAGNVEYEPETNHLIWTIAQFPGGGKDFIMKCQVGLPSVANGKNEYSVMKKRPLAVQFEIPYFTVSGLQVRYLKISEKSGYQAWPWVRYITKNGQYHVRQRK